MKKQRFFFVWPVAGAQRGQGTIEYALLLGLLALVVISSLVLLGDNVRDGLAQLVSGEAESEGRHQVAVQVVDAADVGIVDVPVFVFDDAGMYLDMKGQTDASGLVPFELQNGRYQFLAQHQLAWFWSDGVGVSGDVTVPIRTEQRPFAVHVQDISGNAIPNIPVFAFDADEQFIGVSGSTDAAGTAVLQLVANDLQFRADVENQAHWSSVVATAEKEVTIVTNPCGSDLFLAEYFNNSSLTGEPVFTRCEPEIANSWGTGGPENGIKTNSFSVRWTGQFRFEEGSYSFITTTDDGARLWVDGTLLIDAWRAQSATTYRSPLKLSAGLHTIKLEYNEYSGTAVAMLGWESLIDSCPTGQFLTEYFNNSSLGNAPDLVRCETGVKYNWGSGAPVSGIEANNFSVRWNGRFNFSAGTYDFRTTSDDGMRVWVDGDLLIDAWKTQSAISYAGRKTLTAGEHEVRMEYFEQGGVAQAELSWTPAVVDCPDGQFLAEYFDNPNMSGQPLFAACETSINYRWARGGPGNGIPNDNFSVRWVGRFPFDAGAYEFFATSDDGVQLLVDNQMVINAWKPQSATSYQQTVSLSAGWHTVKVYYYEAGGDAVIVAGWR